MITELHPRYHLRKVRYIHTLTKPEAVIKAVERVFSISAEQLNIRSRRRDTHVWPRQVAHYLLKKHTKMSLESVGILVGMKDHCTVLHSCKVIQNEIDLSVKQKTRLCELLDLTESEYKRLVR